MQSILIFGSTGSLGKILTRYLIKKKFKVFTDQKYKTKLKKIMDLNYLKIIERTKPNYIVNLVALTNVDLCEKNKKLANKSNNLFVKNLVTAIKRLKKYILFMFQQIKFIAAKVTTFKISQACKFLWH